MTVNWRQFAIFAALAGSQVIPTLAAEEDERDYVRFVEEGDDARLETAIHRFQRSDGLTVDLIGAVHIGDKAYYEALNERFKSYGAVLYELVGGPESLKRKRAGESAAGGNLAWVGMFQTWMQSKLGLSLQLEEIDYEAPNFVHADMDVQGFLDSQEDKQESFLGLWWKAVQVQGEMASEEPSGRKQPGLAKILEWMMSNDSSGELKRVLGREFDGVERLIAGIEGDQGTVIIGERNRVVLEVLQREIGAGKKTLAVFYGAAHLPDLAAKLEVVGFKSVREEWETAWDIPSDAESAVELSTEDR
jgi:hypothetical protein